MILKLLQFAVLLLTLNPHSVFAVTSCPSGTQYVADPICGDPGCAVPCPSDQGINYCGYGCYCDGQGTCVRGGPGESGEARRSAPEGEGEYLAE